MGANGAMKQADGRGRVSLGSAFADCMFLIEHTGECIVLHPARVVPQRESWLYQNPEAAALLRTGLEQARNGEFAEASALDESLRIAAKIPDD